MHLRYRSVGTGSPAGSAIVAFKRDRIAPVKSCQCVWSRQVFSVKIPTSETSTTLSEYTWVLSYSLEGPPATHPVERPSRFKRGLASLPLSSRVFSRLSAPISSQVIVGASHRHHHPSLDLVMFKCGYTPPRGCTRSDVLFLHDRHHCNAAFLVYHNEMLAQGLVACRHHLHLR